MLSASLNKTYPSFLSDMVLMLLIIIIIVHEMMTDDGNYIDDDDVDKNDCNDDEYVYDDEDIVNSLVVYHPCFCKMIPSLQRSRLVSVPWS